MFFNLVLTHDDTKMMLWCRIEAEQYSDTFKSGCNITEVLYIKSINVDGCHLCLITSLKVFLFMFQVSAAIINVTITNVPITVYCQEVSLRYLVINGILLIMKCLFMFPCRAAVCYY